MVSDWASTRSTVASAVGGLDLVMPGPDPLWGEPLVHAVRAGEVDERLIDDKVLRLLHLAHHTGRLGEPGQNPVPPAPPAGFGEDGFRLIREVAARAVVDAVRQPVRDMGAVPRIRRR
ncbi:hypothetical protein ABT147_39185 [Streptomyces sp. NPDC001868]|uniref:hypothetical protein n=1 Tax=Streptomyces sp. NPDC001868 TaxID=3154401 RepID=UPI00332C5E12